MENFEIVVGQFNKNNKNKKIQYKIKISLHKKDLKTPKFKKKKKISIKRKLQHNTVDNQCKTHFLNNKDNKKKQIKFLKHKIHSNRLIKLKNTKI